MYLSAVHGLSMEAQIHPQTPMPDTWRVPVVPPTPRQELEARPLVELLFLEIQKCLFIPDREQ